MENSGTRNFEIVKTGMPANGNKKPEIIFRDSMKHRLAERTFVFFSQFVMKRDANGNLAKDSTGTGTISPTRLAVAFLAASAIPAALSFAAGYATARHDVQPAKTEYPCPQSAPKL